MDATPEFQSWFDSLPDAYQRAGPEHMLKAYNQEYGFSNWRPDFHFVKVGSMRLPDGSPYDIAIGDDGWPYVVRSGAAAPIDEAATAAVDAWLDENWDDISSKGVAQRLATPKGGTPSFTEAEQNDPFIKWLIQTAGPEQAAQLLEDDANGNVGGGSSGYKQLYYTQQAQAAANPPVQAQQPAAQAQAAVAPSPAADPAAAATKKAAELLKDPDWLAQLPPWAALSNDKSIYLPVELQMAMGTWERSHAGQWADYNRYQAGVNQASNTPESGASNGNPVVQAGGGGGETTGGGGGTGGGGSTGGGSQSGGGGGGGATTGGMPDIGSMNPNQFLQWLLGAGTQGANILNYKPEVWRGLPVYKYMTGEMDDQSFNNSPGGTTRVPALGVDLPAPSDINYWKSEELMQNNPDDAALWNSMYKAGNRDWLADVARAKMRAPKGDYAPTSTIMT